MPFNYQKQPVKAVISDVTASRAFSTDYQNTTGRPLLCIVSFMCIRANVAGASAYAVVKVDSVTPLVSVVGRSGLNLKDNNAEDIYITHIFMVPNEYYYRVNDTVTGAGSSISVFDWFEVEL